MSDKRKRFVIKFGTGTLTETAKNTLAASQFERLTTEVAGVVLGGYECIIVSSGAVGAGLMLLGLPERPKDLSTKQACAAVGQSHLMHLYQTCFGRYGLHVAQLLLTHQDLDSRTRYRNALNTLERLFRFRSVVPIINENDSVAVEELRFGDNDRLSAEVAMLCRADMLILFTSVEGLLDPAGRCIPEVPDVDAVAGLATRETGAYSSGGMVTKLQAVKLALHAGIPSVIASGFRPGALRDIIDGKPVGTRFISN
ncbi:MAG: glutamate 5-kinase [Verrucomicrobia bacterium]|nr:glutamate 5-kinase [Verrucomicrobiota bacterium]